MERVVAIGLKIPDNTAYTAFATLRRLGIAVERVERCDILQFVDVDGESDEALRQRVERDETLFNPNKHRLAILKSGSPRPGEVWIETLGERPEAVRRYVGWRLFKGNEALPRETLVAAVEALLCNPAIERAIY
ncbi:MAG: hypothetical protein JO160_01705 [Candidatus Eremiobacteraeota bacterium]|nr:hypothetical protein [Candidatus Eremiobacteraeota bacterium]MBV8654727.1 hypothetical protein [Candidatus Eremiobacteraeota bacterium]